MVIIIIITTPTWENCEKYTLYTVPISSEGFLNHQLHVAFTDSFCFENMSWLQYI